MRVADERLADVGAAGDDVEHARRRPAAAASSASRRVLRGVDGAGFSTTVLPAARAGPSFQTAMTSGKFHGAMLPTTPIGRRSSIEV